MIDRRQFVGGAGSLIAVCVAESLAQGALAAEATAADTSTRLNALLEVFMQERFAHAPELLTGLGLDKGQYAWARAQLNDVSLARVAQAARLLEARHQAASVPSRSAMRASIQASTSASM